MTKINKISALLVTPNEKKLFEPGLKHLIQETNHSLDSRSAWRKAKFSKLTKKVHQTIPRV